MQYLISIYFDDKTDQRLRSYIEDVADSCGNTYMTDHHVPPHITISAFETGDEETLIKSLKACVSGFHSGTLQWVTAGAFPTGVLYLAPVLNEYLHNLEADIYDNVSQLKDVSVSRYYQPFQWLPHTTIAKKLSEQEMQKAFAALQSAFAMFEGSVVRMGLAKKNPYLEIQEWDLK